MERLPHPVPFGKYELIEKVAAGGMAEVFRACTRGEAGFEKYLAIKRILPHLSRDTEFVVMLIDEAKIAVTLNHANVVQIYDLGKADGTYFIAMEFVEGADLKAVLLQSMQKSGPLPPAVAVFITMEVLKGLEYAHQKKVISKSTKVDMQIIHRDISPPNILISYEGEVKIVDFGIAKANTRMMETSAGVLKGKFEYMSPEQAAGLQLDCRTDLFSAGLCLYEAMTGVNPFAAETDLLAIQKVRATQFTPASKLNPAIPARLDHIIRRALAQDLEERYQTATEFRSDLAHAAYETGLIATSPKLASYMRKLFEKELSTGRPFVSGAALESAMYDANLAKKPKPQRPAVRRPPAQKQGRRNGPPPTRRKKEARSHTVIQHLDEMETAYQRPDQKGRSALQPSVDATVLSQPTRPPPDMSADQTFLASPSRAAALRSQVGPQKDDEGTDALATLQGMEAVKGPTRPPIPNDDDNGPPTLTDMNPQVAQAAFSHFSDDRPSGGREAPPAGKGPGAQRAKQRRNPPPKKPAKPAQRPPAAQGNAHGHGGANPKPVKAEPARANPPQNLRPAAPAKGPQATQHLPQAQNNAPRTEMEIQPPPPAQETRRVETTFEDVALQTAQIPTQLPGEGASPTPKNPKMPLFMGGAVLLGLLLGVGIGQSFAPSPETSEIESRANSIPAELIVRAENGSVTYVDGAITGSEYPLTLALKIGQSFEVVIEREGFASVKEEITLSTGETRYLTVQFQAPAAQ